MIRTPSRTQDGKPIVFGKNMTARKAAKQTIDDALLGLLDSWDYKGSTLDMKRLTEKESGDIGEQIVKICNQILRKHLIIKGHNEDIRYL